MTNSEIIKLILTILSGGAIGATITLIVTHYRNRIQPVGFKISVDPVFTPTLLNDKTITKVTFSGVDKIYDFDNLYAATVKLQNIGNKDLNEIIIGLTTDNKIKVLRADIVSQDRHHLGIIKTDLGYDNLKSEVDIELKPFNRKDFYEIKLLLTIEKERVELEDIKFSSSSPIKFKAQSLDTIGKFGLEVASEIMKRFP